MSRYSPWGRYDAARYSQQRFGFPPSQPLPLLAAGRWLLAAAGEMGRLGEQLYCIYIVAMFVCMYIRILPLPPTGCLHLYISLCNFNSRF